MRRWALLICVLLIATSCARQEQPPIITQWQCETEIVYAERHYAATLTRTAPHNITLRFSQPSSVNGMIMNYDGREVTATLGNDTVNVSACALPTIVSVLDEVLSDAALVDQASHSLTRTVSCGEYCLTVDPNSRFPQSLTVPSLALTIRFFECRSVTEG